MSFAKCQPFCLNLSVLNWTSLFHFHDENLALNVAVNIYICIVVDYKQYEPSFSYTLYITPILAVLAHLERTLGHAKTEIEKQTEERLDQQKYLATEVMSTTLSGIGV